MILKSVIDKKVRESYKLGLDNGVQYAKIYDVQGMLGVQNAVLGWISIPEVFAYGNSRTNKCNKWRIAFDTETNTIEMWAESNDDSATFPSVFLEVYSDEDGSKEKAISVARAKIQNEESVKVDDDPEEYTISLVAYNGKTWCRQLSDELTAATKIEPAVLKRKSGKRYNMSAWKDRPDVLRIESGSEVGYFPLKQLKDILAMWKKENPIVRFELKPDGGSEFAESFDNKGGTLLVKTYTNTAAELHVTFEVDGLKNTTRIIGYTPTTLPIMRMIVRWTL